MVCIFAEGQITRIGQLLPFRRGFERIMKGVDAPIVPVNLDGVWGSIFSFERGRFLWKMPRSLPYPVTVSFGKPMPPTATPFEVREAVQELQTEAYRHRKSRHAHAAPRRLIRTAHRHPFRFAMGDKRRPRMKWGGVLLSVDFSGAPAAQDVGRPGNGRHSAAAVRSRRAGEFRGDARGQNSGESELHARRTKRSPPAPRSAKSKP